MDPNAALKQLRELVAESIADVNTDGREDEIAEAFGDLDGWLSKGGSLPHDWEVQASVTKAKTIKDFLSPFIDAVAEGKDLPPLESFSPQIEMLCRGAGINVAWFKRVILAVIMGSRFVTSVPAVDNFEALADE
jgi:hypothetical protein